MVLFLQGTHERHLFARPNGWAKGCLCVRSLTKYYSVTFGVVPGAISYYIGLRNMESLQYHKSIQIMSRTHYNDDIMGAIASQITSLTIVFSTIYLDTDQRKHQSSASLAFVRGIHRRPVNSPHKWPVTRKMFHLMTSSWDMCFIPLLYPIKVGAEYRDITLST